MNVHTYLAKFHFVSHYKSVGCNIWKYNGHIDILMSSLHKRLVVLINNYSSIIL